jgi:hypothetical protein
MNMIITDEMLKVAIIKSVEAGLLPRRALKEDFPDAQNIMHTILSSALQSASTKKPAPDILQVKCNTEVQQTTTRPSKKVKFLPAGLHSFY